MSNVEIRAALSSPTVIDAAGRRRLVYVALDDKDVKICEGSDLLDVMNFAVFFTDKHGTVNVSNECLWKHGGKVLDNEGNSDPISLFRHQPMPSQG